MPTVPNDLLPSAADWSGEFPNEVDVDAAACRIQAARRGKIARESVEQKRASSNMKPSQALSLEMLKSAQSAAILMQNQALMRRALRQKNIHRV